jgi:hypothetical protein
MLKLGIGIDVTNKRITASAIDPDAQAFYNRVTAAGGSLSAIEQTAINTLVLDLKGFGLWTGLKAIYPMVGASAAACSQNLKSASFTASFSSGWTFASTGVTSNGASTYMNTTLSPTITLTNYNSHSSVYNRLNGSNAGFDLGITESLYINEFQFKHFKQV